MNKTLLLVFSVIISVNALAGNKIKYYFNQPVDNTVSTGVNAVYLNNCIADTLAAYLSRAKYSLDICVYDFDSTVSYSDLTRDTLFAPKVAAAIDSAYARGIKVRYIYEASNSNTGRYLLNPSIPTLGSPQGSNYTIMHNKFVIIDANSMNPDDATVWTGCLNWYVEQFNWDYNNVVILQDSALAHAYLGEFNMMWGDTGLAPNLATSKFGQYKTDLGRHNFTIEGKQVELYFSPSDGTNNHIESTINSANTDLYFGVYTFTMSADATAIITKYNSGVYVAGINDSWSNSYSPTSTFTTDIPCHFRVYNETATSLFHNKFVIVDPSNTSSDPMVLTGSHNWSNSANTKNDENTIIIHNDTAANIYYQYFKACFNSLGGVLDIAVHNCPPAESPLLFRVEDKTAIYPNPASGEVTISYEMATAAHAAVVVYNVMGQVVCKLADSELQQAGNHEYHYDFATPGMYFVRFTIGNEHFTRKLLITRD